MTAAAGFLLAADGSIDLGLFLAANVAIALIIGSACVFNNYIDRDIDKKMVRTKQRALVIHTVTSQAAITYATLLGLGGFLVLTLATNGLTVLLGCIAYVFYIVLYGIGKRSGPWGTLVGSVPGALSLVAGYTAVTNSFDTGALLLFLIMVVWQMPHFYAIAVYRLKDYKAAGLPVLPAVKGMKRTKLSITAYIVLYTFVASLLTVFEYTGYVYLIVMLVLGTMWWRLAYRGLDSADDVKWGKKIFGFSLLVLLSFSVLISLNAWLP